VTNISEEVVNCPNLEDIKASIVDSIESVSGQSTEKGELTKVEKDTSQVLYQSRYSKSSWNLGTLAP
jgi:lipoate-protein ligase A